jgi:hydrogenase expression/formation protein HypE
MTELPSGKLKVELLDSILKDFRCRDGRVVLGPKIGEDAAVLDMGDRYLVVTADPITFTAGNIGYYSIHVNANDIAVHGARPRWFLATILMPRGASDEGSVRRIFQQIKEAMAPLKVSLIGGHTEVTDSVSRPVVSGMMIGEVDRDRLVTTAGARPGDAIFLTKGIPIEGTAIIASEKKDDLERKGVDRQLVSEARNFIYSPGISVVDDAFLAASSAPVSSMHDPTEGGLRAGLNEVAMAAGVTLAVRERDIPVYPHGKKLCRIFNMDPLGTVSSGALLFTAPEASRAGLEESFGRENIPLSVIGTVEEARGEKVYIEKEDGSRVPLPYRERDEILKLSQPGSQDQNLDEQGKGLGP